MCGRMATRDGSIALPVSGLLGPREHRLLLFPNPPLRASATLSPKSLLEDLDNL